MPQPIKRMIPAVLALLAGAVVILPAILLGMPKNYDLANHYKFAIPFYEALRQGNWYPGWLGTPNFGFGDPVVRFYPPALYYLLAAGRAVTGNWYAGSLLVITLLSALGSFAAYFWARSYVPRQIAVWAGVFYALMPYRLAEFYQAALLAEFTAGVALLFALAFMKRVCDQGRWRDVAGLAAAYAALILSHLPLAVFGSLTLLVYAVMNLTRANLKPALARLVCASVLGLIASSFYWVTMIAEMKWIVADGPHPDPMLSYRHNFIFSTFNPEHESLWWMGLLAIATIVMSIPSIGAFAKRESTFSRRVLIAPAVLLVLTILMSTAISRPVWAIVPYLERTQHPFRWLAVTSTIAPLLLAASVPAWRARFAQRNRALALAMSGLVLMAVTFSFSQTVRGATFLSRTTFDQMIEPVKEAPTIVHWLPIWAEARAAGKPSYEECDPLPNDPARIEITGRTVTITEWTDLHRTFQVGAGAPTDALVRTFYYPHWIAVASGRVLTTRPDSQGSLLISLPAEAVTINLDFREPVKAHLADAASGLAWFLILGFIVPIPRSRK
jgi:hypothetical protein